MGNGLKASRLKSEPSDHPHARGERARPLSTRYSSSGSSPRSWGTVGGAQPWDHRGRIIPTLVGNGGRGGPARSRAPDHPHARGERGKLFVYRIADCGSSPRSWGTGDGRETEAEENRIIPTLVGNGTFFLMVMGSLPDHPHARGERRIRRKYQELAVGSSPRSWGTAQPAARDGARYRIIPTLVGNGMRHPVRTGGRADHPHARGERGSTQAATLRPVGSSPRSWGTVPDRQRVARGFRIIPTLVGNGATSAPYSTETADHPHARGERRNSAESEAVVTGSSPRSWGTAATRRAARPRARIIPTLVGNGLSPRRRRTPRPDHPHARGERAVRQPGQDVEGGSSPRSWGTVLPDTLEKVLRRIIPTLVGNGIAPPDRDTRSPDHPHARGERGNGLPRHASRSGSSPRSWGTAAVRDPDRRLGRIIPTLVGNGASDRRRSCGRPDHPHARGERAATSSRQPGFFGSSPRSWGTEVLVREEGRLRRIIPTLVGNGGPHSGAPWRPADHPHARGERERSPVARSTRIGSSPRSWGTVHVDGVTR